MGLKSRTKGKVFERQVAAVLRARWPEALVRRASQGERADEADVFATGHPALEKLWLELHDAARPHPIDKLYQAERDVLAARKKGGRRRLPVVIWHRIRERVINVSTRMCIVNELASGYHDEDCQAVITMDLEAFLALLGPPTDAQSSDRSAKGVSR